MANIAISLASRVAEKLVLGQYTNGHGGDGPAATRTAEKMILLGHSFSFEESEEGDVPGYRLHGQLSHSDFRGDELFHETRELLLWEGYHKALEILKDPALHVDIMLSDVIMPGLDGPGWVREAQKARPDVKVIFMSGYAEDTFVGGESGIPNAAFMPKPFTLNELTQRVKDQLEA